MDYCFYDKKITTPVIFDTHAHFDDERFNADREELFTTLNSFCGVGGIINCGCDIPSSEKSIEFSKKFPFLYAAVGFHPEFAANNDCDLAKLEELLKQEKVVAVGEIGLDYYWDKENKQRQKEIFVKQIKLAQKHKKPVIIHDRDAHEDTLNILKEYKPKGVLHCFSGSSEMAKEVVKLGMYIGVGGVLTFKNNKKLPEVVKSIPLTRILLETDAPYMAPEPFRGKTNHSGLIIYVAQKLAEILNISQEEVLKQTYQNAQNLFGL